MPGTAPPEDTSCTAPGTLEDAGTPSAKVTRSRAFGARALVQLGIPAEGGFRAYQMWCRDAVSYCTAATFNISSAARVLWLR